MRKRPITILQWNCYVGNSVKRARWALKAWIRLFKPDVIVLSEARKFRHMLANIPGYQLFQEQGEPKARHGVVNDAGDTAVLVRADHGVTRARYARMRLKWRVLSHNRTHSAKRYPVLTILFSWGQRAKVRGSHWPTHGFSGPNKAAFLESAARSKAWALTSRMPTLDIGDLNETIARLARWFGRRFKVAGHHIDALVACRVRKIEHRRLTKGGGDHYANLFRVYPG